MAENVFKMVESHSIESIRPMYKIRQERKFGCPGSYKIK